jgi:hypothetical protein
MIKNYLLGIALISLGLAVGCAKGGNGVVPPPITVDVALTNANSNAIYPTQSVSLKATVSGTTNTAVSWSLSGPGALTTVTPTTATYVAPATAGSQATVTATSVADPTVTGPVTLSIIDITADVSPATLSVGKGLTQQFTAVAVPDAAPQTFTWTCTANGVPCVNFVKDTKVSGLAYYTADDNCGPNCIQISAVTPLDPTGCVATPKNCTIAKASLVTSRINGTYAFRFSGHDNTKHATAVVGNFTASNGSIVSGVEDELTSSGWAQHAITAGSYTPSSSDPNNSNNAGTLAFTTGAFPNNFQVVLDGNGDIQMIEIDGHGTGSGVAEIAAASSVFSLNQTYAFGFTGVDSAGNRVGYAGLLPMDGVGNIKGGQMDVNDRGNTTSVCGPSPCNIVGTYSANACNCGLWHMTLTTPASTMRFDFFIAAGSASKANPLTFYAISTDPSVNPAVSGTMVLQDSTQTYNIAAFKGISVSALTGTDGASTDVSLTLGSTDGNGAFSGQFDRNDAGMILSYPSPAQQPFNYTYSAASTNNGRYTFQMLGNPGATPAVAPLPFVLYASGQNRGFLLDQSSTSVITGPMSPQGKGSGIFGGSVLPGTYSAATTTSGDTAVNPIAANLLLTYPGGGALNVSGTQYPGSQTVTGTYTLASMGSGTVSLTAPSAQNYVIYVLETSGCTSSSPVCSIQDFYMMDVDKTNPNASIVFAKE